MAENKRGGARPGAGRKKLEAGEERVKLWISCSKTKAEKIKAAAEGKQQTLSEYILNKLEGGKMEKLRSYTVNISLEKGKIGTFDFESSYINEADNRTNKALSGAREFLDNLDENKEIGILITYMDNTLSADGSYIGDGNVWNLYTHISADGSNWIKVKEAKEFIDTL